MKKAGNSAARIAITLLAMLIIFGAQPVAISAHNPDSINIVAGAKFYRTELFFGMDIPGGGAVSDEDWNKFLDTEVTPRFPDGFTVVAAQGQYKDKSDAIVKERSRMLVLLYPKSSKKVNDPKIDEIREAYKKAFKQESVMRVDVPQTVVVSF